MDGHNKSFLDGPKAYLESNTIECYNVAAKALSDDLTAAGGDPKAQSVGALAMEFDLVPQKGGYVSLKILGPVGTYAGTSRRGRPITANWIPYLGQKKSNSPSGFGYINLASATEDVIFSAGLSGCNMVVVEQGNGDRWVYHEPTADAWSSAPTYTGTERLRAGPAYSDTVLGGYALLLRDGPGWKILVQSVAGVAVTGVTEHAVP